MNGAFFFRVMYIYIYLFISCVLCVLCVLLRSLQMNVTFCAFFYVLCKRTLHSLRSFTFLRKERIVLLGLISRQKLEKRMLPSLKERNRTMRSECKRTWCPTLMWCGLKWVISLYCDILWARMSICIIVYLWAGIKHCIVVLNWRHFIFKYLTLNTFQCS